MKASLSNGPMTSSPPYRSWTALCEAAVTDRRLRREHVWLGSLGCSLETSDPVFSEMLYELLRILPSPGDGARRSDDAVPLRIVDLPESRLRELIPEPDVGIVDYPQHGLFEIHRDAAVAVVATDRGDGSAGDLPVARGILIIMRAGEEDRDLLLHCLMVVLYRALFHLQRVPLHAASIEVDGLGTCLLVGDKGSGKSTLSLALGRAGATVLGEDHSMLHRTGDGFVVSGCDGRLRLTEKTEAHFFSEPLNQESVDIGGVAKKDVAIAEHVVSRPFRDRRVDRIFFPRVGEGYRLVPVSRTQSALRLLAGCSDRQRFVGLQDRLEYLDYLTALTEQAPSFDLELSPDLRDLEGFTERLRQDVGELTEDL